MSQIRLLATGCVHLHEPCMQVLD
uniref:Uncharacterized protein n=1 Tax=Arundo donax TaxID=35708 RepID=A0A0A8YDM2_ARUDO